MNDIFFQCFISFITIPLFFIVGFKFADWWRGSKWYEGK